MEHDIRPWGEYWVLEDAPTHKVKKITLKLLGRYFSLKEVAGNGATFVNPENIPNFVI